MNGTQKSPSFRGSIILLLLGACISGLLVFQHYHQLHEAGLLSMMCGGSSVSGCEAVNRSEYSSIFGMPVASLGVWFYLSLAALMSLASFGAPAMKSAVARFSFLALVAGFGVDVVLLAVQAFMIKSFCMLCLSTYIITLGTLFLLRAFRKKGSGLSVREFRKSPEGAMMLSAGIAGASLLFITVTSLSVLLAYRDPDFLAQQFSGAAIQEFMQNPVVDFDLSATPVLGSPDAKIRVVVFSDFLCPWCRQIAQSFQQFMPRWKDRVALYYKSYPLDPFCNPYEKSPVHPGACWAALGGLCAAEQGKFWEYHDRIFTLPPKNPGSDAVMKIAQEAGLDTTALSACMHQGTMQKKVRDQIVYAHDAGIDGTPRVYINGRRLPKLNYLTSILAYEASRLGMTPLEGIGE